MEVEFVLDAAELGHHLIVHLLVEFLCGSDPESDPGNGSNTGAHLAEKRC